MRCAVRVLVFLSLLALPIASTDSADPPKTARVLIITGSDVKAHDWRATTPITRKVLEDTGRLEVFVSEEPAVLETSAVGRYDLVVLNYRNPPEEKLSDAARKNLADFVKGGKGLAAIHFAVNAWGDWDEFSKMIGRVWAGRRGGEKMSGHGPKGVFKVRVTAKASPITQGVEDFETDDELYAKLVGDAPIDVLAVAFSENYSKQDEPMAWTLRYGEGRVFVTVLGHDVKARDCQGFQKLFTQGCEWAARVR